MKVSASSPGGSRVASILKCLRGNSAELSAEHASRPGKSFKPSLKPNHLSIKMPSHRLSHMTRGLESKGLEEIGRGGAFFGARIGRGSSCLRHAVLCTAARSAHANLNRINAICKFAEPFPSYFPKPARVLLRGRNPQDGPLKTCPPVTEFRNCGAA